MPQGEAGTLIGLVTDGAVHLRDLRLEAAQHRQGTHDGPSLLRRRHERGDGLRAALTDPIQREALTREPRQQALQTEDDGGLLPYLLPALAQQVSQGLVSRQVNVPSWQPPQSQEVRQPARIMGIIGVLPATIRRKGRDLGEVHDVARVHQAVHEPVPMIGGLHGNALQGVPQGGEGRRIPASSLRSRFW
jgi:hypothetical protein